MIVLIDNYDSFSYNLYQLLGQFDPDITVIRNDEKTVQDIEAMHPDHLIIHQVRGDPPMPVSVKKPSAISPARFPSWRLLSHQPSAKSTAAPLPMPSSSCTANSP